MTKRLGESDRRAVDLLLDRAAADGNYVTHAQPTTEGLEGVQRVLSLLDRMPAEEPAADLMARTMARIDARGGVMVPAHPATAALMSGRPHA
jgi:hypothetical protein